MDTVLLTSFVLGLTLGVTHAFDPDHLVAVGTLAADADSVRDSSLLGVFWGIGHTLTLGLVGGVVLMTKTVVPASLATGLEGLVGVMIVVLGGRLLWRTIRQPLIVHSHVHVHGSSAHRHFHIHETDTGASHHHQDGSRRRALVVGMVHGLAGSAALSLVVMAQMPTVVLGLVYIAIFGIGSIGGMLLMSALMSVPFVSRPGRWPGWHRNIKAGTALLAIGFGSYLTWSVLS